MSSVVIELEISDEVGEKKVVDSTKQKVSVKKKLLTNDLAQKIVASVFEAAVVNGQAKIVATEKYVEALKASDKVSTTFGVQTSYLWALLEALVVVASKNLERVKRDRNSTKYLSKNVWLSRVIEIAKIQLQKEHNTHLPEAGTVFVPQRLEKKERLEMERLIGELLAVSRLATCKNDGSEVRFDPRTGSPFEVCFKCSGKQPKQTTRSSSKKEVKEVRQEVTTDQLLLLKEVLEQGKTSSEKKSKVKKKGAKKDFSKKESGERRSKRNEDSGRSSRRDFG